MSLEKIAQKQALTKEDIVTAANELIELEKQAAEADAYGRQLAHQYVEELVKQAEEEAAVEAKKEGEPVAQEKKEKEGEKEKEVEKESSDKELLSAIETLRQLGIVK
jgi:hypothetical protein